MRDIVQPLIAGIGCRTRKYDHISPVLSRLEWPTMEARRFQHRVMLVRKCVRKEVRPYLQEMFIKNNQIHHYETRQNSLLHINRVNNNFGQRSFSYRSVKDYNSLPINVINEDSKSNFKRGVNNSIKTRF